MADSKRPTPRPQPHIGATMPPAHSLREKFDGHELAIVLSHFDLGALESLREYPRGSRRSPKVRVNSQHGEYLLKRRAAGQDDPFRVAFAHDMQFALAQQHYPLPGLIGTRDNNSMLHLNGRTYEMFNYIHGTRYDRSPIQAKMVGTTLGSLHQHLEHFDSKYEPPIASFHAVPEIDARMALLSPSIVAAQPRVERSATASTIDFLQRAYHESARRVNELGFHHWPVGVVHGDWHPGNLLYRHGRVIAVLDFDSARIEPRIVDVSNAILQFSMLIDDPEDPATWPDGCDNQIIRTILEGYDEGSGRPLSAHERASLPWLMIEALTIESIVPIANTGSFARIPGSDFLHMVQRKVKWIGTRAERLTAAV
jgi:homoserine kinase type II